MEKHHRDPNAYSSIVTYSTLLNIDEQDELFHTSFGIIFISVCQAQKQI